MDMVDLAHAVVVTPPDRPEPERRAIQMLVEEVERRTRLRWPVAHAWPVGDAPVVMVGREADLAPLSPPSVEARAVGPEGYRLATAPAAGAAAVRVSADDARGVLFGVGRLLRALRSGRDSAGVPAGFDLTTTPRYALRGHQLGYRPKTNSYDGWDLTMWEQYVRDLAVFGANAVELIPPRSDDDADSPHFPAPPMAMMKAMSALLDSYGLDVWIWYPALDPDYADPATVRSALQEWGAVFEQLPRIDALFVPGGDPGHTEPRVQMALLERQAESLRRRHPRAQVWVAPQGFSAEWMDTFLTILRDGRPSWLTGVVFGPQVRLSLPELRAAVPAEYPIRHYPDITHCTRCQYPPPDWDLAFARTEGREPINPEPLRQAAIFRATAPHTVGFLTYSEGCNDDVNKAVWSALGWDPDAILLEVLRDYARYFVGEHMADALAQGLLALERNWRGPLAANAGVATTLAQFKEMERRATPGDRLNWRFQQALYRAHYDAYVRRRLLHETELEERAMERLAEAPRTGAALALRRAREELDRAVTEPVGLALRARLFELGEALYQSVRMQLSVPRYAAIARERGANLDSADAPLNERDWLEARFEEIAVLPDEAARLRAIEGLRRWTDPGPGGFHEEPGNPARRPHLLPAADPDGDPGASRTPRVGFAERAGRLAWSRYIETLYDTPLSMRWDGLDAGASYRVRVVYGCDSPRRRVGLTAGRGLAVHGPIERPAPPRPLEFGVPAGATADGSLTLTWSAEPGAGGNGRACQVSEVWLLREEPA